MPVPQPTGSLLPGRWTSGTGVFLAIGLTKLAPKTLYQGTDRIDIGSRLELFVDQNPIGTMNGVTRELHSPERKGAIFTFNRPREGSATGCVTVFDGHILRGEPARNPKRNDKNVTRETKNSDRTILTKNPW